MGLIDMLTRWFPFGSGGSERVSGLDLANPYQPIHVDERNALGLSTVWACVSLIAGDLASAPLILYRTDATGRRVRAIDHPLYSILRHRPNPLMDSYRLLELVASHLLLWGNAYLEVERSRGSVRALWPIPPWLVTVRVDGGQATYDVSVPGKEGERVTLLPPNIVHVCGISYDGITGVSPIRACMRTFSLAAAVQEYALRFFSQGGLPGVILKHPGRLSDAARANLRESWRAMHEGLAKSHRVAILEEGMALDRLSVPPEEAQMIEARKMGVAEIARIFRVPPHMIGDHERGASYASVEQQAIDYVTHTIRPWAVRIERAIKHALLPADGDMYCEFLLDSLLRGDTLSRYRAYAIARQWGWMSANDIRVRENMEPIDGGDLYLTPMNMSPAPGGQGGSYGDTAS